MAFTDESIKAKLSALNETQESISTISQWIMFYRYGAHDVTPPCSCKPDPVFEQQTGLNMRDVIC